MRTFRISGWHVVVAFVMGSIVGGVSVVQVVPDYRGISDQSRTVAAPEVDGEVDGVSVSRGVGQQGALKTSPGSSADPALKCAPGANGGATDQGVSAGEIRMATTVVESGIGRPFLRDVRFAMEAVKTRVNAAGGICGRKLRIEYVDDAWDPGLGAQFLGNFINQPDARKKIFAIPVGPSSEGLRLVINRGDIDKARMPVVGADGMLIEQYVREKGGAQPWVWAVAPATVASARIMAINAARNGAKSFGIIFDKNYRFGQEAARAFNAEVRRLTGSDVEGYNSEDNCQGRYCGIQAGLSSYPNEVREFYLKNVDFTALFLEPQTALTWMSDPNTPGAQSRYYGNNGQYPGYGAAQPLFTRDFAEKCQIKCNQMMVWSGFKPYIESYRSDSGVQRYVSDLQRTNPQADIFNAFAVGGYVGMQLLVEGLKRVGPHLTRARLKNELDHMTLESGLTLQRTLQWRPDWRWVNTTMRGFTILYKGTFAGWREGPVATDPHPAAGTH